MIELKGEQFSVILEPRSSTDPHVCIQILTEDDENWHPSGNPFSSFWLNDLIRQLEAARAVIDATCERDPSGFGSKFK